MIGQNYKPADKYPTEFKTPTYYSNRKTGYSSSKNPETGDWVYFKNHSDGTGHLIFYDSKTKETSLDRPDKIKPMAGINGMSKRNTVNGLKTGTATRYNIPDLFHGIVERSDDGKYTGLTPGEERAMENKAAAEAEELIGEEDY